MAFAEWRSAGPIWIVDCVFFSFPFLLARSTSGSVGSSSASMTIDRKPERADAAHLLVICYSSFSD
jgi:hypothetical protein